MNRAELACLIDELAVVSNGRSIEVNIKPKHPISWFRASVFIKADERDTCFHGACINHVAFGFGATLDEAIRRSLTDFRRPRSIAANLSFARVADADRARHDGDQIGRINPFPRR